MGKFAGRPGRILARVAEEPENASCQTVKEIEEDLTLDFALVTCTEGGERKKKTF